MIEAYGDIWDHTKDYDAIVITTNGFVKKNGEAVMGRGIALEAKERYPLLPKVLGQELIDLGNEPFCFTVDPRFYVITFPVKPDYDKNGQPGWRARAEPKLIINSAHLLVEMVDEFKIKSILMPRPGCGNGGLRWEDVKPILEPILDDRFTVMERL